MADLTLGEIFSFLFALVLLAAPFVVRAQSRRDSQKGYTPYLRDKWRSR
jgi:hypothetical protein